MTQTLDMSTASALRVANTDGLELRIANTTIWTKPGAFDPLSLSGCILALESSDVPAGTVSTWPDRSPENNDMTVPYFSPTSDGSVVTLTGASYLSSTNVLPITGSHAFHLLLLMRSRSVGGSFLGWGAAATGQMVDLWNYNPGTMIWHGHGPGYDSVGGAPAFSPNVWHTVELSYDGTIRVSVDGGAPATVVPPSPINVASNQILLGRGRYSEGSDFDLAGLYLYDRRLDTDERSDVLVYLTTLTP